MPLRPERFFAAIAHPLRLRAALLLQAQGELCVCELTHVLKARQPVVSRHLGQLRKSGLVTSRRDGTWIHYRLADDLPPWARNVLGETGAAEREHPKDLRALASMNNRPEHTCRGESMARPYRLLFLCTGNSCRSQMAEGWARHLGGQTFEVFSAGIEAHGKNPRAIAVMAEAGVDISAQESTRLTPEMLTGLDLVVTVCGHADAHCPTLPAGVAHRHWPLDDPARAAGSEAEIMATFRRSRDSIRARVAALLDELAEK